MKRFQIIYPLVGLAFWLGTWFLAGCSDDTGSLSGQTPEEELIPVTISIGVDDAEDLFTRAEGDDTGEEGGTTPENPDPEPDPDPEEPTIPTHTANPITDDAHVGNDLVVYIMGRDNYTLTYEDFTYEDNRYVAELRLYRGTYQAYAFANHTGLSLTLPGDITNNPAVDAISLVSEDNGIPMSGEAKWEVNAAGEYEVELVRMVGRMDITITDERGEDSEDGNVESVEISNLLPTQTNLLREGFGEVTLPASITDLATWTWPSFALDDEKKAETSFYLHETEAQEYHLTVSFDGGEDEDRDVALARNMIPRNHYFPLYIHIRDYALVLTIQTEVPPIGGIVMPNKEQGSYDIQLPEGCTFSIEAQFKKNGQIVNEARSWSYELEETTDNRIQFEQTSGSTSAISITLSGKATAQSFGEEKVNTMHITVVDPENGKGIPFELNFYIRALDDNENTKSFRSVSAEVQPVIVEL